MENRKFLTKKFVNDNTNSFYYERSNKLSLKLIGIGLVLFLLAFLCIFVEHKHQRIDGRTMLGYIFGAGAIFLIPTFVPAIMLSVTNHLSSKKREAFMKEFRNYNDKVTELVYYVFKNAEDLILANPEKAKDLHEHIRKIENDYTWITDVSFEGDHYNEKGISLLWAYANALTHLAERLQELGIKILKPSDVSIENLVNGGAQINDEVVFAKINKIIKVKDDVIKYDAGLAEHYEERLLVKNEIDEYFAILTRPGLTFTQT